MPYQIQNINPKGEHSRVLLDVWEQSVTATHDFLNQDDIQQLKPYVAQMLEAVDNLVCITDKAKKRLCAFMGISGQKIEMLFVHPEYMKKGLGKTLLNYSIHKHGAIFVDVNEQNSQAVMFYEHFGFKVFKRSDEDGLGNPYPLLHMRYEQGD